MYLLYMLPFLYCIHYSLCFIYTFMVLIYWNTVSYNSCTRPYKYLPILFKYSPYCYTCINITSKIYITNSSSIYTTLVVLKLINNLHSPYFRST